MNCEWNSILLWSRLWKKNLHQTLVVIIMEFSFRKKSTNIMDTGDHYESLSEKSSLVTLTQQTILIYSFPMLDDFFLYWTRCRQTLFVKELNEISRHPSPIFIINLIPVTPREWQIHTATWSNMTTVCYNVRYGCHNSEWPIVFVNYNNMLNITYTSSVCIYTNIWYIKNNI